MHRPLPRAPVLFFSALFAIAPVAAQAQSAAPEAAPPALAGPVLWALAALLTLLVADRLLLARLRSALSRLAERLGFWRPEPPHHAPQLAPSRPESDSAALIASVKQRMTLVHRNLRQNAPELLPPLADYRAVQNRLLSAIATTEGGTECAQNLILLGLSQIEAATSKLSVVLPGTTKEYAFGSYADTLERLSGEAMDCLCGLRSAKRAVPPEVQNGDPVA